jgi:hypothetical protein
MIVAGALALQSPAAAFQALSGSAEFIARQNVPDHDQPGGETIQHTQSALMVRTRARATAGAFNFSGSLQAYGTISGYDAHKVHVDEAWASTEFAGRWSFLGGIQRYPHQYSYYWNPTFPVKEKTDLLRPDYLAGGAPMIVVARRIGGFQPKFITAWNSGETWYGVQADGYHAGVEGYVNGFWSGGHERTIGAGTRGSVRGWTIHVEGSAVLNNQRLYPNRSLTIDPGAPAFVHRDQTPTFRAAAGINRSVFRSALVTLEAFHDGTGMSAADFDALAVVPGRETPLPDPAFKRSFIPGALRRNFTFASYHHSYSQRFKWAVRNVICWDDRSGYVQPLLSWAPGEHVELGIDLLVNYARGQSEFGRFHIRSSASVRFRYFL